MLACETKRLFFVVIQTAGAESDHYIPQCKRVQNTAPQVVWLQLVTSQVSQGFISRIKELLPLQENLLWDPTCNYPEICARITPWEVIASSHFQIGLFQKSWPQ
jgi:hypothetical protein